MGVAKDATRSPEDVISTPLPGETLAMFYARSRACFFRSLPRGPIIDPDELPHTTQVSTGQGRRSGRATTAARCCAGTASRSPKNVMVRVAFREYEHPCVCACLTKVRTVHTAEYKPILEEVERILAEAGLDEEEMRKGAAAGPHNTSGQSRNRR